MATPTTVRAVKFFVSAWLAASLIFPLALASEPEGEKADDPKKGLTPTPSASSDGLYSTIAGFLRLKKISVPNQRDMKLQVHGFAQRVPVLAVMQSRPAPLVVVIPGISGRADADFSRLWPSWYAQAGYHVLTFNSTFRPEFVDISGHGASGHVWVESERIAAIVDQFLKQPEMRGKVERVGIVGMSYGGVQALILGAMARENKLPFEVSAIQAWSPPIRLEASAEIIDRWFREDRWNFTLIEMQRKVGKHKPGPEGSPAPFSDSLMRAAIAASFHEGLPPVVLRNDAKFKLGVLPKGNNEIDAEDVRKSHAEVWGFVKYAHDLAIPFWKSRPGHEDIERKIRETELCALMSRQPAYSEVIVTADDPFNHPDDLERVKSCDGRITLWPRGGHVGYVGSAGTRQKLLALFGAREQLAVSSR